MQKGERIGPYHTHFKTFKKLIFGQINHFKVIKRFQSRSCSVNILTLVTAILESLNPKTKKFLVNLTDVDQHTKSTSSWF